MSHENPNTVVSEQGVLLQDRTVGGVVLTAGMSPTERFQALAKSMETGTYTPRHNGAGPPAIYQTHATQQRLAQGEKQAAPGTIAGKAPPPAPKQLEASNKPNTNLADFDAEMRAAGKQLAPQPRDASGRFASVPADQVDAAGIEALNKAFAALSPTERDAKRAQYTAELTEFYEGRRLGETRGAFQARKNGGSAAPAAGTRWSVPGANGARTLTPIGQKLQADLMAEWKALPEADQRNPSVRADYNTALAKTMVNERGVLSAEQFSPDTLSGYKLPPGEYVPEAIQDLAKARAAGLTQAQVETAIRNLRGK